LRELPLQFGGAISATLYLILADPDLAGPGVRRLAEIIRTNVARQCRAFHQDQQQESP
jgi:hypothetical protein